MFQNYITIILQLHVLNHNTHTRKFTNYMLRSWENPNLHIIYILYSKDTGNLKFDMHTWNRFKNRRQLLKSSGNLWLYILFSFYTELSLIILCFPHFSDLWWSGLRVHVFLLIMKKKTDKCVKFHHWKIGRKYDIMSCCWQIEGRY